MEYKKLDTEDYEKIAKFTAIGMELGVYFKSDKETLDYARFMLYHEILASSSYLALYDNGELVGVLFYDVLKDPKLKLSPAMQKYHDDFYQKSLKENPDDFTLYPNTVKELRERNNLDEGVEITHFVVDPSKLRSGIGSIIYDEFEKKFKGKKVFLFTDKYCKYTFYEKKGFKKIDEKTIMFYNDGEVPESVLLYVKKL